MTTTDGALFREEGETLDEVLDGLKVETEKPIQEEAEKETPTDSPAAKEPEADTQSPEGDKKGDESPEDTQGAKDQAEEREERLFNKRWKERIKKADEEWQVKLDAQSKLYEEKLRELKPAESQQIPGWVKKIYGDSPEGADFYKEYLAEEEAKTVRLKQQIFDESQQAALQKQKEAEKWQGWVEEQLGELKEEGKIFDKNKLMKIATDYMPTDEDGNIDFRKAYALYEKLEIPAVNAEKSQARKQLAAMTTDSKPNTSETKTKDYQTSATLRNKSWFDLES